jgi:hypothetical protein
VSGPTGVNPVDAMSEAQEAEALAEAMVFLGTDFEAAVEGLTGAVSEHVAGGLDDYDLDTMEHIRRVAQNGVNLWWTSMTEEEQEQAVRDHPELLRELDGIPAAVRDRLNRDHLDDEIERFEEEIAERDEEIRETAARGGNGSDAIALGMANDDTLDDQLAELKELRESLGDESADRYLLALNTEGDGRAIVANGNPTPPTTWRPWCRAPRRPGRASTTRWGEETASWSPR